MWAQLHVVHPCIGRLSDELWSPAPSSLLCFFLNTRHGNALVPNAASAAAAVAAAAAAELCVATAAAPDVGRRKPPMPSRTIVRHHPPMCDVTT